MKKTNIVSEDPLSRQHNIGKSFFGIKKTWWWLFITLALLMAPLIAHEAEADSIGAVSSAQDYAWNAGSLSASIIIDTIITLKEPEPREVKAVTGFGNGTCVPYARQRSGIKLYGNAATFLERAIGSGYATGTIPAVGAIIVTNESTGHVAVVEEVANDKIKISEQNYKGLYIVSERWFSKTDERILGYIY